MIDIEFVIGNEKQAFRSEKIRMVYVGQMSVSYTLEISIYDATKDILSFLLAGRRVSIYVRGQRATRSLLFSGVILSSIGNKESFKLIINDFSFYIIKNFKIDSFISGELSSSVSKLLEKYDVTVSKRYTNAANVDCVAQGFFRDFIDVVTRGLGLVWNAVGDKLVIGDGWSGNSLKLEATTDSLESNSITYRGSNINIWSLNVGFDPSFNIGDKLTVGKKTYIIVKAMHTVYINDEQKADVRTSNLTLLSNVADMFNYVSYSHDMRRTFELQDVVIPSIKFDTIRNTLLFYDPRLNKWLGDLESIGAGENDIAKDAYFSISGNVPGSTTVGVYIPYNIYIVSFTYRMDTADDTAFEIMRDTEVVFSINTNNIAMRSVDIGKIFAGAGQIKVKRSNFGTLHCYNCIIQIRYRRVI